MNNVTLVLLIFVSLVFWGCGDDSCNCSMPEYQEAIYIINSDGSDKIKLIELDACTNVQFIPNSNKLLYVRKDIENTYDYNLYTINVDGSGNTKICDELNLFSSKPKISEDGQFCYTIVSSNDWSSTSDIYEFDLINNSYRNITNNRWKDVLTLAYKENTLVYALEQSQDVWSLIKLDLINNQLDTLLIAPENTFINPITFGNTTNEIFFSWTGVDFLSGIYKMNIAENVVDTVTTETYGGGLSFPFSNDLFIEHTEILHLDLLTNNLTNLVDGVNPDFYDGKMIYDTGSHDYNNDIRIFDLSNMEDNLITSHGFRPMYSENGEKIVFIGDFEIRTEIERRRIF